MFAKPTNYLINVKARMQNTTNGIGECLFPNKDKHIAPDQSRIAKRGNSVLIFFMGKVMTMNLDGEGK